MFPCQEIDPDAFFPENINSENQTAIIISKRVCSSCFAKDKCLQFGNETSWHGTYGGLTEGERFLYRARRGIPHPESSRLDRRNMKLLFRGENMLGKWQKIAAGLS